jgi:hypothetical protein
MFTAKGMMLKGMSVSEMRVRRKLKLGVIAVSAKGAELGKTMRGIRWGTQQGSKTERFWFDTGEDIKGVSGDDVREARDYSNAVPGVRRVKEGIGIRRRGRKSRGRFRT